MKIECVLAGGAFASKGYNFEKSGTYEVKDEVAEYLVKTFPTMFKGTKVETKAEPKVETKAEPKVETKVEAKAEPKAKK